MRLIGGGLRGAQSACVLTCKDAVSTLSAMLTFGISRSLQLTANRSCFSAAMSCTRSVAIPYFFVVAI